MNNRRNSLCVKARVSDVTIDMRSLGEVHDSFTKKYVNATVIIAIYPAAANGTALPNGSSHVQIAGPMIEPVP